MSNEIYNVEDVKNEFLQNILGEYGKLYSQQQVDLAVYFLNDFVNNLVANELVLVKIVEDAEEEPMSQQGFAQQFQQRYEAQQQQRPQQPQFQQQVQQVQRTQPVQQVQQVQQRQVPSRRVESNPFNEAPLEYSDPRNQRVAVNERVAREVAEMNQQLRASQSAQASRTDFGLGAEKPKTFVDKIKEMRSPKKREGINPEE